jgi:plasmid stabilization system protein ParE
MARRVVLRPAAERDLQDLYAYIRDARGGDPAVAIGYIRRIRAYCEGLEMFPERGVPRDDIRPGLRLGPFERRVVVAYIVTPDLVRIGRILYGGQNYEALLGESGEEF